MNISPPIAWRDVPVGAVVLDHETPRTVLANSPINPAVINATIGLNLSPAESWRAVLLEGLGAPLIARADITTHLVLLDTADAVANLRAAGFTVDIVEES